MHQSEVMKAWRAWLKGLGIPEHHVRFFMHDYARCCYLQDCLHAAGIIV